MDKKINKNEMEMNLDLGSKTGHKIRWQKFDLMRDRKTGIRTRNCMRLGKNTVYTNIIVINSCKSYFFIGSGVVDKDHL